MADDRFRERRPRRLKPILKRPLDSENLNTKHTHDTLAKFTEVADTRETQRIRFCHPNSFLLLILPPTPPPVSQASAAFERSVLMIAVREQKRGDDLVSSNVVNRACVASEASASPFG
eukprot:4483898-Pleurochrysis_carterae.AAC.1